MLSARSFSSSSTPIDSVARALVRFGVIPLRRKPQGVTSLNARYHYFMSNPKPVTLHLDDHTLQRLEALAKVKGTDYLTLAAKFVTERLDEEKKREGLSASLTQATPEANRYPPTDTVEIYTDGGCRGNPGPGGWAALIYEGPSPKEISGAESSTTNQRMEIRSAIEGLRSLNTPRRVRIYSDSAYLINSVKEGWLDGWQKNGWKTAKKKPVKNTDLWRELLEVIRPHEVEWIKVEGHAGIGANERCHHLVQLAIDSIL